MPIKLNISRIKIEPAQEDLKPHTVDQYWIKKKFKVAAIRFNGVNHDDVVKFSSNKVYKSGDELRIRTLEGDEIVNSGDYVVRGTKGEYYPVPSGKFPGKFSKTKRETEVNGVKIFEYETRQSVVRAIMFDGKNQKDLEKTLKTVEITGTSVVIKNDSGDMRVKVGDFIVHKGADEWVVEHSIFLQTYEQIRASDLFKILKSIVSK